MELGPQGDWLPKRALAAASESRLRDAPAANVLFSESCKQAFQRRIIVIGGKTSSVDCTLGKRENGPRLRLLSNPEPSPPQTAPTAPSLASAPFRPGEIPLTAWVPLDPVTRNLAWEQSKAAALPTELWVRLAVEASRLANEISALTARPRQQVIAGLDLWASKSECETPTISASELRHYASELRRGHPTAEAGEVLALRLSEEMSGAWNAAASKARAEMPHWIASALKNAPPECVTWEAAAAATCRSLGEWAYASWLRTSASARA
jgi:hypothetical protein